MDRSPTCDCWLFEMCGATLMVVSLGHQLRQEVELAGSGACGCIVDERAHHHQLLYTPTL